MSRSLFRRRLTLEEQDEIRSKRSKGIRDMLGVVGIIFLVAITVFVSATVLIPYMELYTLRQEQEHAETQLHHAQQEEEEAHNIFSWMSDFEFFEQIARDSAHKAKDGEKVIHIPAAEPDKTTTAPARN